MMPSQKLGSETPSRAKVVDPWSTHERGRSAATMPAGKAMTSATTKALATSWSVTGSAPRMSASAGCLETHDVPKFPASTARSQRTYWTTMGWSSPISRRICAITCGVASVPSMTAAGSPGMSRTIVKTMIDRKNRTRTSWTDRSRR